MHLKVTGGALAVLLWCDVIFKICAFHAYNMSEYREKTHNLLCPNYADATRPFPIDFSEKLKLWPRLTSLFDEKNGESLYGSKIALEEIWKNQNPENCSNAKFLVSGGWPYGFGSRIHMEGIALAIALNLGRVYLPQPDGDNFFWETHNSFCRNGTLWEPGMNCYYERYSKCTARDAGRDVNAFKTFSAGDFAASFESDAARDQLIAKLDDKLINVLFTVGNLNYDGQKYIPRSFIPLIECSPIKRRAHYFWWRVVSATFIARPNDRVLKRIDELVPNLINDTMNCISVHVRHGDKGIEMRLLPFATYRDTAVRMWHSGMVPGHPWTSPLNASVHNQKNGSIFLSSEDVGVFAEAVEWGKNNGWGIYYTEIINRAESASALTHDQWVHAKKKNHEDLEYLSYILNMQYSLRCEAFVCTLKSNTCRIIDELRATVAAKANRVYADLSSETCKIPPCFDGEHIDLFGER